MAVFCCGSLHLDVLVTAPHLPRPDETVAGNTVEYIFGGKGGNQALSASKMGSKVSMVGRVGSDNFGNHLLKELKNSTIDISQVQRDDGPSGMSVAILDSAGNYGAVIVSASNLNIDPELVIVPADTKIILLQNEISEDVNLALAQKGRIIGSKVILNAAPARAFNKNILDFVDLLVVNRVEAEDILGHEVSSDGWFAAVEELAKLGPNELIMTLGADGLIIKIGVQAPVHIRAHNVTVKSTHGAGDMFLGALAAHLDQNMSLLSACHFAQKAAALHVGSQQSERKKLTKEAVLNYNP